MAGQSWLARNKWRTVRMLAVILVANPIVLQVPHDLLAGFVATAVAVTIDWMLQNRRDSWQSDTTPDPVAEMAETQPEATPPEAEPAEEPPEKRDVPRQRKPLEWP